MMGPRRGFQPPGSGEQALHTRCCSGRRSGEHTAALVAAAYCLYSLQCTTLWEGATQRAAPDAEAPPPANMLSASAETAAIRACARPCMAPGAVQYAWNHSLVNHYSS